MSKIRSWFLPSYEKTDSSLDSSGALPVLISLVVVGLVGIFVYALRSLEVFILIISVGSMVAGASLLVGSFIGFLFGIPRTLIYERPQTPDESESRNEANEIAADFRANTNLEQISDWLTKILVGVGLTQISEIPQALDRAANAIQAGLGSPPHSYVFALAILVYFPVCGFLIGYLWTRLFLPGALTKAEVSRIRERERKKAEENAIISIGSQKISEAPEVKEQKKVGLWVDDNPSNNANLKQSFENLLNMEFDLSLSTDEALAKLKSKRYDVIISDMGRPPDRQAGYTLLRKIKELNIAIPFIIYASGASIPANQAEAEKRGASGSTSSPQELLGLLRTALKPSQ